MAMGTQDAGSTQPGSDASGTSGPEAGADAGTVSDAAPDVVLQPAVLRLYYSFDDQDAGATVTDVTGNGNTGELHGNMLPVYDPLGHNGQALVLDGTQNQYVAMPVNIVSDLEQVSIAAWVNLKVEVAWNRLFDFNANSSVWFYYSPTGWNFTTMKVGTHIAISGANAVLDPEMQLTTTLPSSAWHHVAVVLAKPYLNYYIDGVLAAQLTNMSLSPKDLGPTSNNWIGRSAYTSDPYLSAEVDEFRLYSGVLSASDVAKLAGLNQ
jgi:hypothetical protein